MAAAQRILIVDDDRFTALLLSRYLQRHAHVEVAHGPAEALARLANEPFHVVCCDMNMPLVSGVAVLAFAKERWPKTRRVLMSGSAARPKTDGLHDAFLPKPFTMADLSQAFLVDAREPGEPVSG